MDIERFDLERWQSIHEHGVEINLSESGVHPLRLRELVGVADLDDLLGQELGYTQTNGTLSLRERVAALYDGASAANVLVTNGGSEANFVTCWHLIEPGDEVVVIQPTYMQIPGLVRSFGATVHEVWLEACHDEDGHGGHGGHADNAQTPMRWRLDLDAVRAAVTPRTRCIAVCNPNNPTGARLDEAEVAEICAIAEDRGCWVLADEIYRGAELDGRDTPSAWGRHDRVIVTGGLSKAYGLPGLRIGWIAGSAELVEQLWGRHDYTTIAPGAVNDLLARLALAPSRRGRLLARTRDRLRENQAIVWAWVSEHHGVRQIPPEAGGVTLMRYPGTRSSAELAETLRTMHGVLVVPGVHFGLEHHLRIGIGGDAALLRAGLARLGQVLEHG
ncbi:MAG: aminotransferase class I/II-fold pyridoxal phosphate-dependent enzyme [Acidobacteria bacterium]|nr:aminotransferase class I/II-fold pyridoxal phosphate-dependent enzyme [Acidobacteriota bacterium]